MLARTLLVGFLVVGLDRAQTPLRLQLVTDAVPYPLLVTAPRGDLQRVFVLSQAGRVHLVKNGVLLPTPFLDLTPAVSAAGELGLLGMAFHPDYATNGFFYVLHTMFPFHVYVKRFRVSTTNPDVADPTSVVPIFDTPLTTFGNHNGGMLAFDATGCLNLSIGDGGTNGPDDPFNNAQRTDTYLGKILRLDVDHPAAPLAYGIPPNNPFAAPGGALDEIWAYGLRNPYRFSFDRLNGDMYIGDVGGWHEEIDFEPAGSPGGRNYGWSCMSGTHCNAGSTVCVCNAPALTMPLHDYSSLQPAGAVIGGHVYRGVAMPDWRGAYFFGDYMLDKVWALRHNGTAVTQLTDVTAQLVPPAPYTLSVISGFGEDGYGEIYVCNHAGQVYRIEPVAPVVTGVVPYGVGTPGCAGAHTLSAPRSPVVGHPAFTLRTAQAPASGIGLLAFATQADVAGSDPGLGFLAHVQVPSLLGLWTVLSDPNGVGTFAFAIPPSPPLTGTVLHAQSLWLWNPATCSPSPYGWSSSPGLQFVVQP